MHSIDNEIRIDWHPDSGSFTWGRGEVRLPAQSELIKEHGIDTEVGRFASRDGVVEVRYDIGTLPANTVALGLSKR